jgi:hypothetical protein
MILIPEHVDCKRCQEFLDRMFMFVEGNDLFMDRHTLIDLDKHLWNHGPDLDKELQKEINKIIAVGELSEKARDTNLSDQELNWLLEIIGNDGCDIIRDDSGIIGIEFQGDAQTIKRVNEICEKIDA